MDLLKRLKFKRSGRWYLPIIVPIIVFHGEADWGHSDEFRELYPAVVPDELAPYMLSFRHQLVNVSGIPDDEFSDDRHLTVFFMLLKYSRSPMLNQRVRILLIAAQSLDRDDWEMVVVAIQTMLGVAGFEAAMENLGPGYEEMTMDIIEILRKDLQQEWLEREREKARQEGRDSGRQEERERARQEVESAKRQFLMTVLEGRFGPLPNDVHTRILAADADTLDNWASKVGRAADLESIFR